jgi:putative selenate reductase FAD-binding subunit
MISEYYRPKTLEETLELLSQKATPVYPMGGGTALNRPRKERMAVVDLQALDLGGIQREGNHILIGATTTLQQLYESTEIPEALRNAIHLEASLNLRNAATAAGTLVAADGRSPFATAMLGLDAHLVWLPGERETVLGDYLPLRGKQEFGKLIVRIVIPANARLSFENVARSPDDRPVVCAALARWPSGRTRLALGGYGSAPVMAMDGTEAGGVEMAARSAYAQAGDAWASAAYRQDTAGILARRCLSED